jgi:hypothetical protein
VTGTAGPTARRPGRPTATAAAGGRDGGGGQAGRVSILLAVTLAGLLFIIGVAHDVGDQVRAALWAEQLAAEAARAGGQAVDLEAVAATGEQRVDPVAAERAALSYLSDAGVDGQVTFSRDLTEITVSVTLTRPRVVLGLFGFGDYRVTRRATAQLVSG